jgi:hypothetical protein
MRLAPGPASPVRLILLGLGLEAVYLAGFVLPYNLLVWLSRPAQDLASMGGTSPRSAAGYLACVAALGVGAWLAYRESRRLPPRRATWIGFGFAGLFALTLVWAYPFDALDVFDYAMHGRMLAVLGANPYIALPAWFPDDPFLPSVGWKTWPSVYGPVWTYLEGVIGWLSGDDLLRALLLLKGVAAASSLACACAAYRIARRWMPRQAPSTIVLVAWNPLVVLMAGSGHNGLLMMALFLAGIWLIGEGRPAAGLWLAGVSALIKPATVPLVVVLAVGEFCDQRRARRSVGRGVVVPLAVLLATSGALYAPLWPGLDRLGPLLLQDLFSQSPLGLLRELWIPSLGEAGATEWAARLGQALLVLVVAGAMWRARRGQWAAMQAVHDASFWIIFGALGWWQPWYVIWFATLAAIDHRPWMPGLSWVASLAGLVALFDRFYLTQHWLAVDMLQHQLHTVLLVFLPPIVWACMAPRLPSSAGWRPRQLPVARPSG